MIRRVLCLFLVAQLLLVQGLLCRTCTGSCGQTAHAADRPHIHLRQIVPGEPATEPQESRCSCSRCRSSRPPEHVAKSPQVHSASQEKSNADDVIYLSGDPLAALAARNQVKAVGVCADMLAPVATAQVFRLEEEPHQAALPPLCLDPRSCPLYLLNLALLI